MTPLIPNTILQKKQLPSPGCFATFAEHSLYFSPYPPMDNDSGHKEWPLDFDAQQVDCFGKLCSLLV